MDGSGERPDCHVRSEPRVTAATFALAAPPAIRCGHRQIIKLPVVGAVEARCWNPTIPGGEFCPRHHDEHQTALMWAQVRTFVPDSFPETGPTPTGLRFLCPAPTSKRLVCARPLPCTSHNVTGYRIGVLLYGSVFAESLTTPHRWWHRFTRRREGAMRG